MQKRWAVTIVTGAILLAMITGCQSSEPEVRTAGSGIQTAESSTLVEDLVDLSDRLDFPQADQARATLFADEGFLKTLTENERAYYLFDVVNQVPVSQSELTGEWTQVEREKLIKLTMEFEDAFKAYGMDFDDSITLVKVTASTRLPEVFSVGKSIVLSQAAVDMHKDNLKAELIRACFDLYTNQNPKKLDAMAKLIGFEPVPSVVVQKSISDKVIKRPQNERPYVYEANRKDIDEQITMKWTPITVRLTDDTLADYMVAVELASNGDAFVKAMDSNNVYLPEYESFRSVMAVPLDKLDGASQNIGELPAYYSHPQDILSLNFMYLVLDRPVTGTGTVEKLKNWLSR